MWEPHVMVVRVQAGPRYEPPDLPGAARTLVDEAAARAGATGARVQSLVGPEEVLFVVDCAASPRPDACLEAALDALVDARAATAPTWPSLQELEVTQAWWTWALQGHAYAQTASPLAGTVGVAEPLRLAAFREEAWSRSRWHVYHGASLASEAVTTRLDGLPATLGPDEALMRPEAAPGAPMVMHLPRLHGLQTVRGVVGLPRDLSGEQRRALWELWACAHPDASTLDDLGSWALLRATDPVWLGLPSSGVDPSEVSCSPEQVASRAAWLVPGPAPEGAGIPEARRLLSEADTWLLRAGDDLPEDPQARTWPGTGATPTDGTEEPGPAGTL